MKLVNIPILIALFSFCIGIVIYEFYTIQFRYVIYGIGLCFAVLTYLHYRAQTHNFSEIPFIVGTALLFAGLGNLKSVTADEQKQTNHFTHHTTIHPQQLLFSIQYPLKSTKFQDKYIAQLQTLNSKSVHGTILITLKKDSSLTKLKTGAWYHAKSKIAPLPFPRNPYQFDYGAYLKRKQIYGQVYSSYNELIQSENNSYSLRILALRFRESVLRKIDRYSFSQNQKAIISALLLGKRDDIAPEISKDYAAAGMMHILAVSGLHVGILLMILRFLTGFIYWYRIKWLRSVLIICCLWSFAFTTGLSPSVLRAATMFSFLEVGSALGGKRKSKDAVLVSAMLLLIYDPSLLFQVGFQLSYLAVMAILWIQPWISNFYTPRFYVDKILWDTTTVTIAAQLGVMPLSLFYFHQFPGLFLLSNIVILPFLGLIIGYGLIVIVLALFYKVPAAIVDSYGWIVETMNSYIHWVATQEKFVVKHIVLDTNELLAFYITLITVIAFLKKYTTLRLYSACFSVLLLTGLFIHNRSTIKPSHFAILHQNRRTVLTHLAQNNLTMIMDNLVDTSSLSYITESYQDAVKIERIVSKKINNYYRYKQKNILIIDSAGIYNVAKSLPHVIVLSNSPRINIDRLISLYPNAIIVADGSNYKSYVSRWKASCLEKKIPFHNTYEMGAFYID